MSGWSGACGAGVAGKAAMHGGFRDVSYESRPLMLVNEDTVVV